MLYARPGNYEIRASVTLGVGERTVELPLTFLISSLPVAVPQAAATRVPVN